MPSRHYTRLEIIPFGEHLLRTGDLDPVYIALTKLQLPREQLSRWLLGYWCLYSCGFASWASEQPNFYHELLRATRNVEPAPIGGRWPRGRERRYWRGKVAEKAVGKLAAAFPRPEDVVSRIAGEGGPFAEVAGRAKTLPLFGPWISFKICDMLERVLAIPVDFDEAAVFMFKDPVQAAVMLWQHEQAKNSGGLYQSAKRIKKVKPQVIHGVVGYLLDQFKEYLAPPRHERPVNLQEIETILCKWKSHQNGHYPLYNDIHEIREGLTPWAEHSPTAAAFLEAMPDGES